MECGYGAQRTICACLRPLRSLLRRSFLHRDFQSEIGHRGAGRAALLLSIFVIIILSGCGYRVGGTASRLPPGLKVIAVPALENRTNQFRVEQRMTQAVVREFISRTKYR